MTIQIKKRDGTVVKFEKDKIVNAIFKAARSVGGKDKRIAEELADNVAEFLKKQGRTLPSVEEVQDAVEKVLIEGGHVKTAKAYILYRQKRADVRQEKMLILEKDDVDEVDKRFDTNALRVLKARYLRKDDNGKLIETPKQLFTRVAVHAALPDILYDKRVHSKDGGCPEHEYEYFDNTSYANKITIGKYALNMYHLEAVKRMYDRFNKEGKMKVHWSKFLGMMLAKEFDAYEKSIDDFYGLMKHKKFMPNTPAIANFGSVLGMGSACFVTDVEDSIDDIMEKLKQTAIVFKSGGGMGYNFSKLRPEGDFVRSTCGVASGPITFMKLFDTMTEVIKQGGCVASDTLVRTDKGSMPMGDMLHSRPFGSNPTKFFTYDGSDYNHALMAMDNGPAEVDVIKTDLGIELSATFNHMVATVSKEGKIEWRRMMDIKEGDWLVVVPGGHNGKAVKLPQLPALHHNSNKLNMPEFLTEELAELLGLYMSDGCFNRGRMIFTVNAEDKELMERIERNMKETFNLSAGEKRVHDTYVDMVFFSTELEKYFSRLEWKKSGSPQSFIPSSIFVSEEGVACSFLRGLFEGDGSIHKDGYALLYSSSKKMMQQTQQLLLALGIVSHISEINHKPEHMHKGKNQMYKLMALTEKGNRIFAEKIGFISSRKTEKFSASLKAKIYETSDIVPGISEILKSYYKYVGRGSGAGRGKRGADRKYYRAVEHYINNNRNATRKNVAKLIKTFPFLKENEALKKLVEGNYFFTRVTAFGKGDEHTMEIEVPATGFYVANGLLVHNIRRGANMGIMNINHPDIEKFITAKDGNKALRNFNISVLVMGDFWKYYESGEPYPLLNPKDGKVMKHADPRKLFDKIVYQAWESAEPGVLFFDNINKYNPFLKHLGPIVTTNPCVASDTKILTENGWIEIEKLADMEEQPKLLVDARTLSYSSGQRQMQAGLLAVKAEKIWKTGEKETLTLITDSGNELTLTPDHKILTKRGWTPACKIRVGEKVLSQDGSGEPMEEYICSIKNGKTIPVYDITEPKTHSFIANGIVVHNCGEVLLYGNESCNLGSINVWAFIDEDGQIDWDGMKNAVMSAAKFLDNVMDVNKFPLKQIQDMTLSTRKTGLGIMGVGDLLYEMGIPYNTDEGRAFMERIFEFINYWSKVESVELAKERGSLPYYDKSFYPEGKMPFAGFYDRDSWHFDWDALAEAAVRDGIRNGFTTVIAPTGSISMIAGCSSGIEPVYSLAFEKNVKVGSFFYVDPAFEKAMQKEGLLDNQLMEDIAENSGSLQKVPYLPQSIKRVFVTANDITPEDHIMALAAFQKWTDSSISKTNNFPADATVEHMRESYMLAYKLGCKGVTVFRDSSIKDQVLVSVKKEKQAAVPVSHEQQKLEAKAVTSTHGTVTEAFLEKKSLGERNDIRTVTEAGEYLQTSIDASTMPLGETIPFTNPTTTKISFDDLPHSKTEIKSCPSCDSSTVLKEGCISCTECGWGLCS